MGKLKFNKGGKMYAAINAVYENGQIIFSERPPTNQKSNVIVMFLEEKNSNTTSNSKGVKIGSLCGKGYSIPDDFNEPLDDLSEYM
jgi:hypothetical protein